MKRTTKLVACSAVALAFIAACVAQDKKPELTDPGIFHADTNGSTITYGATTLNAGPTDEIVHCDNTDAAGRPSKCHLVGNHTLDDVIQFIWQDGENRRAMYKEAAEELKQRLEGKCKDGEVKEVQFVGDTVSTVSMQKCINGEWEKMVGGGAHPPQP